MASKIPMYTSAEELQAAINSYFDSIIDPETRKYHTPPTHIGLAIHLGFASRQSLYDYAGRDNECSYPIKMAMARIERYVAEELSIRDKPVGLIFLAKNMGYSDRQIIEHDGEVSQITRTELPSKKPLGDPITPESPELST